MSVADDGTLNPSPFTVEAWVRPASTTGSQAVVRKDGEFYVKIFDGKLQGWLWTNPTTKVTVTSTAAVVVANQWQQVAMTYNGTTATLYRNGASVGSASLTATVTPSANPLRWGDALTGGLDQNFLSGWIDEPAIYGSALSATEINNHYKAAITTPPTPPGPPTGLGATGGQKQVALSWTGSQGAASYNVYRGTTAGGEGVTPIKTGVTTTSYTDTGLADSTTYYYKVTAVGSGGEGAPSNEANATNAPIPPPGPPTGLGATGGQKQVALSWTGSQGAASYNVYRGTTAGGEGVTPIKTGVTTTSYTDTGLADSTTVLLQGHRRGLGRRGRPQQRGERADQPAGGRLRARHLDLQQLDHRQRLAGRVLAPGRRVRLHDRLRFQGRGRQHGSGASPGAPGGIFTTPTPQRP